MFSAVKNEDWGNMSAEFGYKSDSEICSIDEDTYGIDNPVVLSYCHISIPHELLQSEDSEDILPICLFPACEDSTNDDNFEEMLPICLGPACEDLPNNDNSEEMFNNHKNRNIKDDLNRRHFVDKVFDQHDGLYAKFLNVLPPRTPDPKYNSITSFTPNYLNFSVNSCCSDLLLDETFSTFHDLPPEKKSSLLSGVTCYVDVRSANEDMTASVQEELLSLGAGIQKNFTKKVTHVVFKEGRVSTYLKANKEGVPLVSVLWIEECKKICGVADPALHPPRRLEKYKSILPFQTVKKRRMKYFNPHSKIRKNILQHYNDPSFVPTLNGKKLAIRTAATVSKDKVTNSSKDKKKK